MTHVLGDFYEDCQYGSSLQWPALAGRPVTVGGVTATYAQAAAALAALSRSGGVMVAQVLRAARSPLADCDYHGASQQFLGRPSPGSPSPGGSSTGRGAAGRPVTRQAFMAALAAALDAARAAEPALHFAAEIGAARRAFAADAGYAAAMARAAVDVAGREHLSSLRLLLAQGSHRAVSACEARRGQFTCTETAACGTGGCRFASGALSQLTVPAGPGRMPRPGNHASLPARTRGFGLGPALAALEAAVPHVVGVRVAAADSVHAADAVPGASVPGSRAAA